MSTNPKHPFVTVILPIRNEARYIGPCLDSILETEYPLDSLEVLVIDGDSTDETAALVSGYSENHPFIKLLHNPHRTVPYAMNIGIKAANGEIIVRMDAHASYATSYIPKLIEWMAVLGADNVGGICLTRPASDAPEAYAVATILSHPFGVGDSHFRIATSKEPREVDTVPFGCYKKTTLERLGYYDVMMTRNQDDELNARLRRQGGRIFLIPEIQVEYFARDTLSKMSKMLYQYGYFKPLVALKVGRPATLRQFAPPVFAASVLFLPLFSILFPPLLWLWACIIGAHSLLNLRISSSIASNHAKPITTILAKGFFMAHMAYGLGYLKGTLDFVILGKHKGGKNDAIALSR